MFKTNDSYTGRTCLRFWSTTGVLPAETHLCNAVDTVISNTDFSQSDALSHKQMKPLNSTELLVICVHLDPN